MSVAGTIPKSRFTLAAQDLNISEATLKNWLKQGLLKSVSAREIQNIKNKIQNRELNKLNSRANKFFSSQSHAHAELLTNKENYKKLIELCEKYGRHEKSFWLAVYLLQLNSRGLDFQNLKAELACWGVGAYSPLVSILVNEIKTYDLDLSDNLLGFVYQLHSQVGAKHKSGAYYTPNTIIQKALNLQIHSEGVLFDPCCGAGNFLVQAYYYFKNKSFKQAHRIIIGCDSDENAVLIARANLTLATKGKANVVKQIQIADSLSVSEETPYCDYIMTNPPWGAELSDERIEQLQIRFGLKQTKEIFSFFILSALEKLRPGGFLSFVLPASFLNIKTHREIRRAVFTNYKVTSIVELNEKFSGVLTQSILLNIKKAKPSARHEVVLLPQKVRIKNRDLIKTEQLTISLNNSNVSLRTLAAIEKNSPVNLKNKAQWILGIVTGNNKKYLLKKKIKNSEPVILGSKISPFQIKTGEDFLLKDFGVFQQVGPMENYRRTPKLVYRFICKDLVFAVDRTGSLCLNSANSLVPQLKGYSIEFLCGLFNSQLAQYYFHKKYNTFKVLRNHIETFPLPKRNSALFKKIEKVVMTSRDMQKLNYLVLQAYGLDPESCNEIENYKNG
ncbi:MAG: N-6 DNA methylase [Pseudobdellovibrio sp.]